MLQNLAINCYERARLARQKAVFAISDDFKADCLAAEGRWLTLAQSYEHQHRLSRTISGFDRRRRGGAVVRIPREHTVAFDPDDVTRLTVAYHAVLSQLGLVDKEDAATLLVAKRIIDLASQGERDPERLTAATIEALSK